MRRNALFIPICFLLFGCAFPRIYVIDDPLSASQRNELGFIYESQGNLDLAEKEYALAVKRDRSWATPRFNLGNVYFKMGEYEKAKSSYLQALDLDKENPDVMNNLAYVLCVMGQYEEAEKWVNRALSLREDKEYLDTRNKIRSAACPG